MSLVVINHGRHEHQQQRPTKKPFSVLWSVSTSFLVVVYLMLLLIIPLSTTTTTRRENDEISSRKGVPVTLVAAWSIPPTRRKSSSSSSSSIHTIIDPLFVSSVKDEEERTSCNNKESKRVSPSSTGYNYALSRRNVFQRAIVVTTTTSTAAAAVTTFTSSPYHNVAHAEEGTTTVGEDIVQQQQQQPRGLLSTSDVANLLRHIPTFTIVDENGVPYMVVGEDAKVTGYFFTTYGEAQRVLTLARSSADRAIRRAIREGGSSQDVGTNPWTKARVSTVPLDYAITLVSKSGRKVGGSIYFKLAPAQDDVEDALTITGDDDLPEGKVPLFYYEDFTTTPVRKGAMDGSEQQQQSPLYFRKEELERDYRKVHPGGVELPPIKVSELFAVLAELVRPGGTDDEIRNVIFVPPRESEKKRTECLKRGGDQPAFVIGQRIIVL